jgi:hypothetical protein
MEITSHVENVAVSKTMRLKDVSRLREFLSFCKSLGINEVDVLPAPEDLLVTWASSFAG